MSSSEIEAAHLLLTKLGIRPQDLLDRTPRSRPIPTFGEYIPHIEAATPAGTARTYRPYWRRLQKTWHDRRLDEPTTLELRQMVEDARQQAVTRRNSRGGRSAAEHMAGAIRSLYRHARNDGHIPDTANPAEHVDKPRRAPSPRTALSNHQLAQINNAASTTGNDPELDTIIVRAPHRNRLPHQRSTGSAARGPRPRELPHLAARERPIRPLATHLTNTHARPHRTQRPRQRPPRTTPSLPKRTPNHPKPLQPSLATDRPTPPMGRNTWRHRTLAATHHPQMGRTQPRLRRRPRLRRPRRTHRTRRPTLTYVRASLPEVALALSALVGEPHPLATPLGTTPHD
ncbi:hypothetical protein BJY24_005797 [Nocardia transvalensis]|uniref:Uncharacterized protein n=1 Tax=Nocardia transvalensis TaxID=37333 RepID=A0A7W9PJ57_9NOCA|nr:hypothetical protein [Nocardia transvalensis]